jgi:hypothetical protein
VAQHGRPVLRVVHAPRRHCLAACRMKTCKDGGESARCSTDGQCLLWAMHRAAIASLHAHCVCVRQTLCALNVARAAFAPHAPRVVVHVPCVSLGVPGSRAMGDIAVSWFVARMHGSPHRGSEHTQMSKPGDGLMQCDCHVASLARRRERKLWRRASVLFGSKATFAAPGMVFFLLHGDAHETKHHA